MVAHADEAQLTMMRSQTFAGAQRTIAIVAQLRRGRHRVRLQMRLDGLGQRQLVDTVDRRSGHYRAARQFLQAEYCGKEGYPRIQGTRYESEKNLI